MNYHNNNSERAVRTLFVMQKILYGMSEGDEDNRDLVYCICHMRPARRQLLFTRKGLS